MRPQKFAPLPASTRVIRVLKRSKFFCPPDYVEPGRDCFRVTDDDRAEAARRGRVPGVSVFDVALTTVTQAVEIRRQAAWERGGTFPDPVACVLSVTRAAEIATRSGRTLQFVYDPLEAGQAGAGLPGADGHTLMEGVDDTERVRKSPAYKSFMDELAQACVVEQVND